MLEGKTIALSPAESKHCVSVLRLAKGAQLQIADGQGTCALACIEKIGQGIVYVTIQTITFIAEEGMSIHVIVGWLKGQNNELIVQKCTELGVRGFCFTQMDKCVVKGDEVKLQRFHRIAVEACKQSGRLRIPVITSADSLKIVIGNSCGQDMLWLNEREKIYHLADFLATQRQRPQKVLALCLAPEGGFSSDEVALLQGSGAQSAALDFTGILRSETAAISAVAAVMINSRGRA